jgi:hypothetical protein
LKSQFGFAFDLLDHQVDFLELIFPTDVVQELTQIVSIIIYTICFSMVAWSQNSSFVPVDAIEFEEPLNFDSYLVS